MPNIFPRLPPYGGKFKVGCQDIEWTPLSMSKDIRTELLKYPVLVRLYYPAELSDGFANDCPWLPKPERIYAEGYSDFLKMPRWFAAPFMTMLLSGVYLPAFWGAPLVSEEKLSSLSKSTRLPVIIFSHGLGGNRTTYSTICGNLASIGCLVCAIEHRDNSGSMSVLGDNRNETIAYRHPENFESECHYEMRRSQVEYRQGEILSTLKLVSDLDNGCPLRLIRGNAGFLDGFKDRMNIFQIILTGHSFGAATVIEMLKKADNFGFDLAAGIILDPWMFPLEKTPSLISCPLLCVNTEQFTKWESNFVELLDLMKQVQSPTAYLATISKTVHQNQCDVPALFWLFSRLVKGFSGETDPVEALNLNCTICVAFLTQILEKDIEFSGIQHMLLDFPLAKGPETVVFHDFKHPASSSYRISQ